MSDYIERDKIGLTDFEIILCKGSYKEAVLMLFNKIEHLPAADVRPVVRGEWRPYSPLTDTYECDKCGYQVIDESFRTNYCPNCGAWMEGVRDNV